MKAKSTDALSWTSRSLEAASCVIFSSTVLAS
jgi:hypothetical protein